MRLNRFLAQCGVASRRKSESWIAAGRVTVNGQIARTPATQVDPETDQVEVDGEAIGLPVDFVYMLMNKPPGYDVTRKDRFAERIVYDLLAPATSPSVKAVGRLDRDTTGLLLLTNDGDLAFRLTHPRFEVEKEYLAFGEGAPDDETIRRLREGIELDDGWAKANFAGIISPEIARAHGLQDVSTPGIKLVLHQGRKRIVRRMCLAAGYPLVRLHRSRVGTLELGDLKEGRCRTLDATEVGGLRKSVGLEEEDESGPSR